MCAFLSSDRFHALIAAIVRDLSDNNKSTGPLSKALATAGTAVGIVSGIIASVTAGPAAAIVAPVVAAVLLAAWGYNIYQQTPGIICCLIGYVVDLTLILQVVFQVSLQNEEGKVEEDQVMAIVDRFDQSSKKKEIHDKIKGFIDRHYPFTKISVVGKIESLITANRDFIVESGSSTTLTAARHVGNTTLPSTSGS
ncbi:hypothetical protein APHAL10511_005656 [Amanita phalloides]|nr:hypothetical protein APHAL10511_005656 [Amanita phalloides]